MEAIVECCCGLDVHQASVVACLLVGKPGSKPRKEVRTFGTVTAELRKLREWLAAEGCTHVGMESTGVYWMPVYSILEGAFALVVGNATHIKQVPGRKTDVKDSEWIADLLRHGLIRRSFVPPKPLRELRVLVRYRRKLVGSSTSERNRMLKLLETANIKLASVVSDVFGVSGRRMLRALLEGQQSPSQMAELAKGRMRTKLVLLSAALDGRVEEHHRYLLEMQLRRLEQVEADIEDLDRRIDEKLVPYREPHTRLMQIPGVDWIGAAVMVAELGVDMSVFPSARHCAAWAGVCPGNNESAGKRRGQSTRKGNVHLTTALVQAAISASHAKGTYLKEKYWRLKARRGPTRAAMAIAHKILIAAYHMLSRGVDYKELGDGFLDQASASIVKHGLVKRLERLGFDVTLQPKAPSAEALPAEALPAEALPAEALPAEALLAEALLAEALPVEALLAEAPLAQAPLAQASLAEASLAEAALAEASLAEAARPKAARPKAPPAEAARPKAARPKAPPAEAARPKAPPAEAARPKAARLKAPPAEAARPKAARLKAPRRSGSPQGGSTRTNGR